MSDIMIPIPFGKLMNRILQEYEQGACFGMHRSYKADPEKYYRIFGRKLETQIGPAAGPNSQLAQNIIASYYGGARFFELKTVQKMDGRELAACVAKPCILAEDECYNCEWSTELTCAQARDEYVKAWFALKVIAREWELGAPDGFQFNISVGYDLAGIQTEKVNDFIDTMKNAKDTEIFRECKQWLAKNLDKFRRFTAEDLAEISPEIINAITVSTLHGCPPKEIESIASYLISEKGLHTFVKCNPTLLGYEEARAALDELGFDYVSFTDFHFKDDLQFEDAVPMLSRLNTLAQSRGLEFGVKITNTFPVDVKNHELPSEEMYMSGKSLYPLSLRVAGKLSAAFDGKLRIAYSGGCDYFNIDKVVDAGIWPVTVATTILKTGGYTRFVPMAEKLMQRPVTTWEKVDIAAVDRLIEEVKRDRHHLKPLKPIPSTKSEVLVPLIDCFSAPCTGRCPIHQDITSYNALVNEGKYEEALRVILSKNPLPFITGNICNHSCQTACTRNHYEDSVQIRTNKLIAARKGFDAVLPELKPGTPRGKKILIIGAGPAGIAAAFFLGRSGCDVTVYDENECAGGVVSNIIPYFRLPAEEIQKDVALAKAVGAKFVLGQRIENIQALKEECAADIVILAIGAHKESPLHIIGDRSLNALDFLQEFNRSKGKMNLGKNVIVIGAGNTAMDTARAAKRTEGVENVYLVYRRTKKFMPADEEELVEALAEGVILHELLAPVEQSETELICRRTVLSDYDASGRRSVTETEEIVKLPCDTLIASIGEQIDTEFYRKNGIALNEKGRPVLQKNTNETSIPGIYAAGDGAYGASVAVKAIADAKLACEAIIGEEIGSLLRFQSTEEKVYEKKQHLEDAPAGISADHRCLSCDYICENCVDVCPNRANFSLKVPGRDMHQIIHVDYMCNECGNCATFCPYASAPYKDKFTLFASIEDMQDSTNDGFVFTSEKGDALVRLAGKEIPYTIGQRDNRLFFRLAEIVDSVYTNYPYLLL